MILMKLFTWMLLLVTLTLGSFRATAQWACPLPSNSPAATWDSCFSQYTGNSPGIAGGQVFRMRSMPDGKILVGGSFSYYNGKFCNRLLRLNTDGSLDTTFMPNVTLDVYDIAPLPNGQMYVTATSGSVERLCRLNSDGRLDANFYVRDGGFTSNLGRPSSLAYEGSGRLLIAGSLRWVGNRGAGNLCRILSTGYRDYSFMPMIISNQGNYRGIEDMIAQPDGKILLCGGFDLCNGRLSRGLCRLNPDGSRDSTIDVGTGIGLTGEFPNITGMAFQADGKLLIVGEFTSYKGIPCGGLIRLDQNFNLDPTFNAAQTRFVSTSVAYPLKLEDVAIQPDGKILVSGSFNKYGNTFASKIARLNPDGTLDPTFNASHAFDLPTNRMLLQSDGRLVVTGIFTTYRQKAANRIVRLFTATGPTATELGIEVAGLTLSPNPATALVSLQSECPLSAITLIGPDGKAYPVRYQASSTNEASFSVSGFPPALYTILVRSNTGQVSQTRLAVAR